MKSNRPLGPWWAVMVAAGAAAAFAGLAPIAAAAPVSVSYGRFQETKTIGTPIEAGHTLRVDGQLVDASSSSIINTLFFAAKASTLAVSAGWLVAPAQNRTLGVNIDLYDAHHLLVASDVFQGVSGPMARSELNVAHLVAGAPYQLVLTGSAEQAGRYALAITAGGPSPAIHDLSVESPRAGRVLFDTQAGVQVAGVDLRDGDQLRIDATMTDDAIDSIRNEFTFTNRADSLSAGIEWIVGQPGNPQRTVGVNVDLFDFNNILVASDTFVDLIGGQGFSQLVAPGIGPGVYTLRFTGSAVAGSRYQIHMTTDALPPDVQPITDDGPAATVAEPRTWALVLLALAGVGLCRRPFSGRKTPAGGDGAGRPRGRPAVL